MKCIIIVLVSMVAVLGALFFWFLESGWPPKEASLIQNFNSHRAAFEKLRDMLESDQHVRRVADWGVETDKGIFTPPTLNFTAERFAQYMDLLKVIGGIGVARNDALPANPVILLWRTGFAGNSFHVGFCWKDDSPNRLVTSLDQFYRDHKSTGAGKGRVFRQVDGNWYLWTDIASE